MLHGHRISCLDLSSVHVNSEQCYVKRGEKLNRLKIPDLTDVACDVQYPGIMRLNLFVEFYCSAGCDSYGFSQQL